MNARSTGNAAQPAPDLQTPLSIGMVYQAITHHPVKLFLFLLLGAGAATAVWVFLPQGKMTGYSILQVRAQPEYITQATGDNKVEFNLYRQTQAALIKGRLVLNAAVSQPDVSALPSIHSRANPINWLETQLKIDFKTGPELMKISMEGDHEAELKAIVTAVTEAYLKEVVNKDKAKRLAQLERLTKVYRKLEETMNNHRKRIRQLAESLGATEPAGIGAKEKWIQEEMGNYRKDLALLEREILRGTSDKQVHEGVVTGAEEIAVPPESINAALKLDPQFKKLQDKELAVQAKIDLFKKTIAEGVTHPGLAAKEAELVQAQAEIKAYAAKVQPDIVSQLREKMILAEKQQLEAVQKRVALSTNYRKTLEERLAQLHKETKEFKVNQVDLEFVKVEIAQTEKMADRILGEIEAIKPELDSAGRVSMWEEPVVVPGAEGNRRLKYSSIAGLGILFMGLSLVTGLEYRSRRLNRTDAVVAHLGLRVIGTVPALTQRALSHNPSTAELSANASWQRALLEAVDNTRTLLLSGLDPAKSIRTIMITSALPAEGKTSLSGHLAVSMARAGFKTLLIDADMRRPKLHKVLGVPLTPGLSDLLRGQATLEEVIRPTPAPGLSIIPAGRFHPTLPGVLAGNTWKDLKAQFETEYDYVIVDSAPLLPVADSLLLARHVDGVILALLHDVSRLGAVQEAKDRLNVVGTDILGVVINGANGENYTYSHGYYYYQHRPIEAPQPPTTTV